MIKIEYLKKGKYVWSIEQGEYSLANIKKQGGICVDQAYYAVITARASGIPSIYFSGKGRTGGHAWFSFMKSNGRWELDVGRYGEDKYTTGFAIDPQTNKNMTDHGLEFEYNRIFQWDSYKNAKKYFDIANIIYNYGKKDATAEYIERSLKYNQYIQPTWRLKEKYLEYKEDFNSLLNLFDNEVKIFKKYPDYVTLVYKKKIKLLKRIGKTKEAERELLYLIKKMKNRDDIYRKLYYEYVIDLMSNNKIQEAINALEDVLKKQKNEKVKLLNILQLYMKIIITFNKDKKSYRFITKYLENLYKSYSQWNIYEKKTLLVLLINIYTETNDKRKLNKIKIELSKLKDISKK